MPHTKTRVNHAFPDLLKTQTWCPDRFFQWQPLIYVVIPMVFSLLIFWVFRPPEIAINHLLFSIFHFQPHLDCPQHFEWLVYNLPGALWMYAFLFSFISDGKKGLLRCLLPLLIPVGIEFLQFFHITDGTFDPLDLLFYSITWLLYFLVWNKNGNQIVLWKSMHSLRKGEVAVFLFFFMSLFFADVMN
ncbi:MAG: hypothetical protein KJ941_13205 [Bacteroidetes bacterium]|nr:hypothetical protein [Bacteroidota bacterium]